MWEECQAGGQQVQAPDAAVLLARLRKACQCVRRGERTRESHQGFLYNITNYVVLQGYFVLFGRN